GTRVTMEDAPVADVLLRRHERLTVEVFDHDPGYEALEHRHLDLLALASPRLVIERGEHRGERAHRAGLVRNDGRHITRLTYERGLQRGDSRRGLNDVVVRGLLAVGAGRPKAVGADVDDAGVHRPEHLIRQPEAFRRARSVIVEEHVGALG